MVSVSARIDPQCPVCLIKYDWNISLAFLYVVCVNTFSKPLSCWQCPETETVKYAVDANG